MDSDTAIGGPRDRFPSTRESLPGIGTSGLPHDAMSSVIGLYWKPVYKYIRLKFHKNNEDAKDLTQSFFAAALQRDLLARFDPARASFRTYLKMAVERFAASQHAAANRQKRGGGITFELLEEDSASTGSPGDAFEREWQRQLFSLALDDLRAHCESAGKYLQLSIFESYDLASGERPSYAALAAHHGVAETAVTNHLAWARRMLRAFVTERLRGVTSGERELRQEMRAVWS